MSTFSIKIESSELPKTLNLACLHRYIYIYIYMSATNLVRKFVSILTPWTPMAAFVTYHIENSYSVNALLF